MVVSSGGSEEKSVHASLLASGYFWHSSDRIAGASFQSLPLSSHGILFLCLCLCLDIGHRTVVTRLGVLIRIVLGVLNQYDFTLMTSVKKTLLPNKVTFACSR